MRCEALVMFCPSKVCEHLCIYAFVKTIFKCMRTENGVALWTISGKVRKWPGTTVSSKRFICKHFTSVYLQYISSIGRLDLRSRSFPTVSRRIARWCVMAALKTHTLQVPCMGTGICMSEHFGALLPLHNFVTEILY